MPHFRVVIDQDTWPGWGCGPCGGAALMQRVELHYNGNIYAIGRQKQVFVNNRPAGPGTYQDDIRIYQSGNYMSIQAPFGIRLQYDGQYDPKFWAASDWKGLICGLCGNYDGDASNDWVDRDGNRFAVNIRNNGWIWGSKWRARNVPHLNHNKIDHDGKK
jgi:hypothetical protein